MKRKIALILNILLIVFEILGFVIAYKAGEDISPAYFTQDSNLICLIASVTFIFYYLRKKENNKIVNYLRFLTTINLVSTFAITLFLLAPTIGYTEMMLSKEFLFFHTLCPIVSLISYLVFEKYRISKSNKIIYNALTVSVIYSVIMYALNFMKMIHGPYDFFMVYDNTPTYTLMTFFGISIGMLILAFALIEFKRKIKV